MWKGVYINIHCTLQVSKMGFQCGKWFLNCDKCSGPFIAEETFSSILAPLANSVMINGGYAESRKRKNGIRSCYCPFSKYFIDWRIKKKYGDHARFLDILSLHFEINTFSLSQLKRSGQNSHLCWYNMSIVHLVLLSQYGCHLLSLYSAEIPAFPIIYWEVPSLFFST